MHDNILCKCHFCPWTGVRFENRANHLNTHFNIRPYPCSFCDAKFYRTDNRADHERCIHDKIPKLYKCGSCEFETFKQHSYKTHIITCKNRKTQNKRTRKNTCVIRNTLMRIRISEEMIDKIHLSKICFVYFFLHHKHKFVLWKYIHLIPEVFEQEI